MPWDTRVGKPLGQREIAIQVLVVRLLTVENGRCERTLARCKAD